jgi:hypothetical protein
LAPHYYTAHISLFLFPSCLSFAAHHSSTQCILPFPQIL